MNIFLTNYVKYLNIFINTFKEWHEDVFKCMNIFQMLQTFHLIIQTYFLMKPRYLGNDCGGFLDVGLYMTFGIVVDFASYAIL